LLEALRTSSNSPTFVGIPPSAFVLATDTVRTDGGFLLVHFLISYLKSGRHVCFVALEQSLFHYVSVCRKLGFNLTAEQNKGTFNFINGLSEPYLWTSSLSSDLSVPLFTFASNGSFQSLFDRIYEDITKKSYNSGFCIIIDSVNLLLNFGKPKDIFSLIHYLKVLVEEKTDSCLVALIHEGEDDKTVKMIIHQSSILISVEELSTGYSKDINGQVSIKNNQGMKEPIRFHYKAMESNIKLTNA